MTDVAEDALRECEARLAAKQVQLTELGATNRMLEEQCRMLTAQLERAVLVRDQATASSRRASLRANELENPLLLELVSARLDEHTRRGAKSIECRPTRSRRRFLLLVELSSEVLRELESYRRASDEQERIAAMGFLENALIQLASSAYTWVANLRGQRMPPSNA